MEQDLPGKGRRVKSGLLILLACAATAALADPAQPNDFEEPEVVPWKESDYSLPPFPKEENLVEFSVAATPTAKFYVDKTAIGTGTADNVVRYIMVVKTEGGATNISYEGIRCDSNEYRIYAVGTREGAWARSRVSEWRRFRLYNAQQKSLANNYFCPNFDPIRTVEEGLDALRRGLHPLVAQRYY
jgi:hypothetical protein